MSDIVERLQGVLNTHGDTYSSAEVLGMMSAARDEIERLKAALQLAQRWAAEAADALQPSAEENTRLRAEVERLRTDYAFADVEIRRLRTLLYRCQVAWVEDDSDLAAEVRTALKESP